MSRRDRKPLDVDAVLCGAQPAEVGELLGLINYVNPTDRGRRATEQAERYAVKDALVELLIERHKDTLEVEMENEERGVVSIRRRLHRNEACHAVWSGLSDEARSWIRNQLDQTALEMTDVAVGPSWAPPKPRGDTSLGPATAAPEVLARPSLLPADLHGSKALSFGRAALERYDYPRALAAFERACDNSATSLAGVRALLGVYVDQLAMDADAISAIQSRPEHHGDDIVRGLIALAHARLGHRDEAERWMRGTPRSSRAEIWLALGRHSLRSGRPREAVADLDELASLDGAEAAFFQLKSAVATTFAPMEEKISRLASAGEIDEAVNCAKQLLADWPTSEVAKSVLSRAQVSRDAALAEALVAEASSAETTGDLDLALLRLREAAELRDDGSLHARIASVTSTHRRRATTRQVDSIVDALARNDALDGLAAYVGASRTVRERARSRRRDSAFDWLDQMRAGSDREKASGAVALRRAEVLFADGGAQGTLQMLAFHRRVLAPVKYARELREASAAVLSEEKIRATGIALRRAREAFDAGHATAAADLLESVDVGLLNDADTKKHDMLSVAVSVSKEWLRRAKSVAVLTKQGALLDARAELDRLFFSVPRGQLPRWHETRRKLEKRIRERFSIFVVEGGDLDASALFPRDSAEVSVDGDVYVHAQSYSGWLVLRYVDLPSKQVLRTTICHLTNKRFVVHSIRLMDDRVAVFSIDGDLVEVGRKDGQLLRRVSLGDFWSRDVIVRRCGWFPDGDTFWVETVMPNGRGCRTQLFDIDRKRVRRKWDGLARILPVAGSDDSSFYLGGSQRPLTWHGPTGVTEERVGKPEHPIVSLCEHPSGAGRVALALPSRSEAKGELFSLSPEGRLLEAGGVSVPFKERIYAMASAREENLIAVLCQSRREEGLLVVAKPVDGRFVETARVEVPPETALVRDPSGARVFCVARAGERLQIERVTPRGVEFDAAASASPERPAPSPRKAWLQEALNQLERLADRDDPKGQAEARTWLKEIDGPPDD